MQRPQRETVTLEDILITEELSRRNPRPANLLKENQALHALARQLINQPETMLQSLVDMALELWIAGTAGVSLLETTPTGEEIFRWNVLAGTLAQYVGGSTPRNFSPCGVCLERGTPVLFSHPERYFTYFQEAKTPVVEGLVLPLIAENHALGTIWIMSHDEQRHFDSEDVRVMTSLADFTAAALLLNQRQTQELLAVNATLEAEIVERKLSEERSLALIENLPGGAVFVVDRNLRYLLAEGEALGAAGFKREDFVGKTIFEVLPPELAAYYEGFYRQALAGELFEHEHNAHDRAYVSRGTPLYSAKGEVYAALAVSYDITDRKQAEAALRDNEAKLAQELADTKQLQHISSQLIQSENINALYEQIVDAAIALMRSDMGSIQILDPARNELQLLTWKGFNPASAAFWEWVRLDSGSTCGVALRGERAIVPDVEKSDFMAGTEDLDAYRLSGIKAVQSTPLLSRSGRLVGMFSTHWREPHQPSDRELRFLDLLARQAADLIEQRQAQEALCESEAWLAGQKEAFQAAVKGATLEASLGVLVRTAVEQSSIDVRCAFYIADETGSELRHVVGMSKPYAECVDGFKISADSLACDLAFYTGQSVITPDVTEDPRWKDWLWLAEQHEYRGVWSFPIETTEGKVVGTFAMYFRHPREATPRDYEFAAVLTRAAAIIISQNQEAVERARTEESLRQSEAKYRSLFENVNDGFCIIEMLYDDGQPFDYRFLEVNSAFEIQSGLTQAIGKTAHDFSPNLEAEILTNYETVLATGEPIEFEIQQADVGRYFRIAAYPYGDPQNKQLAIVFNDITDRKRREQNQAMLAEITDELVGLEDIAETMNRLGEKIARYFGAAQCVFGEFTKDLETATVAHGWKVDDAISLKGTYRTEDFFSEEQIQAGEPFVVNDTQTDRRVNAENYAALGIGSFIVVPLMRNGEWRFMLPISDSKPREWRDDEVDLLREITDRIWARVERARAEEAMRESELQRVREQSAREEERQRAESLAELDRAKTLFFSNVSHEFRTPLTLLLAPLQDALSDSVNPPTSSQRERLELAHRNSLRLLKLVNTLLDFSRIEAGRMEAIYEPTDLALYTTELASVFRSAIERAGLRLVVDCPPMSEPVYVDREMWEKIVLNLLSNAFKFTLEGEIAVRLYLADGDRVTLQVEDTGTGIAPEELPHLFERFYQVRSTKARTHEGSGIGLALVQELIRLHGGTIGVSSTVGVGSCFTVTIALGTAHLPSVSEAGRDSARRLHRVVGDHITATRTQTSTALGTVPYVQEAERWLPQESVGGREAGKVGEADSKTILGNSETILENSETISGNSETILGNSEIRTSPPDSPAHILIVDDNADMRDYLTRILSGHVTVEAFADGATALAAANERVPDLVLSDVMMPGLDGFELLKALRADVRTKEVPIILLSARAGEESVIEGLLAGADDYLIKPFSASELVTRVNAYLQMAHLRSETLRQERTINRRKDEILSTVSHELNTPLVAILGWTRLLRSSPSNQAMLMKSMETIERNATLQAKLVEDLLDISRITAGKICLNQEPVQLQGVIEAAIASVHQSCTTKDICLECTLDPLPRIVQGDPERLQQIVLNLLTNAVKFTHNGGRIAVSLQTYENQAQIILSDTGCGISAEFLPYIFDTFRQADGVKKGLGLGLAIARNLVELHGGTIHAQSPGVGQGATFIVKLPLIIRN
ncbi:ATP-binding protein [Dendronalium sp. ChiSLP03b]|uniref:ATP-binding protein n=1 Tax=Dendronalium sp. ChiSLP03b TaxID=3075381 RepID=UPI00391BB8D9